MIRKLLCFIGYHNWTWKAEINHGCMKYYDEPPDEARCSFCNTEYGG